MTLLSAVLFWTLWPAWRVLCRSYFFFHPCAVPHRCFFRFPPSRLIHVRLVYLSRAGGDFDDFKRAEGFRSGVGRDSGELFILHCEVCMALRFSYVLRSMFLTPTILLRCALHRVAGFTSKRSAARYSCHGLVTPMSVPPRGRFMSSHSLLSDPAIGAAPFVKFAVCAFVRLLVFPSSFPSDWDRPFFPRPGGAQPSSDPVSPP